MGNLEVRSFLTLRSSKTFFFEMVVDYRWSFAPTAPQRPLGVVVFGSRAEMYSLTAR